MPDIAETPLRPPSDAPLRREIPEQSDAGEGFVERRRPGRLENPSPHLIGLMRGQTDAALADMDAFIEAVTHDSCDDSQPPVGQGILYGILFSIPLWIAAALVGRWLLHH